MRYKTKQNMQISKHVSLIEATKSDTATRKGIDNTPTEAQIASMKLVAEKCFEPIRANFDKPIHISSFFRCDKLNKAIGGVSTSQHGKGEAMDLDADTFGGVTNQEIFEWAKANLKYDQLIREGVNKDGTGGWIHISYKAKGNRQQTLNATFVNGKAKYTNI